MTNLINCLRVRACNDKERLEKADKVEMLAVTLLNVWKKETAASKGATFYMHAVVHHLPEMIRCLPVDVLLASGDSFEAKNQQLKRILRRSRSGVF